MSGVSISERQRKHGRLQRRPVHGVNRLDGSGQVVGDPRIRVQTARSELLFVFGPDCPFSPPLRITETRFVHRGPVTAGYRLPADDWSPVTYVDQMVRMCEAGMLCPRHVTHVEAPPFPCAGTPVGCTETGATPAETCDNNPMA